MNHDFNRKPLFVHTDQTSGCTDKEVYLNLITQRPFKIYQTVELFFLHLYIYLYKIEALIMGKLYTHITITINK